jgi:tape measure domain-containing protein
MATELERLLVRIDASTEQLRRELKRADDTVVRTEKKVDKSLGGIGKSFKRAGAAAAGFVGAMGLRELVQYSDQWKQLEGRLRVVTKSQEDFNRVQSKLVMLADQNRSSIGATVQLYSRLAMAVGENEQAMKNILPVTEAIAKGVAITGESAASAQGAIVQFAQGLATNFEAAGQEIRSLQEQAPRVAKALADGLNELGVTSDATAGSLNKLARDGVINAENAMQALASQLGTLQEEFERTDITVGQSLTKLDNAFLKLLGTSDNVRSTSALVAQGIGELAENLDVIADAAILAAIALTGRYIPGLIAAATASRSVIATQIALDFAIAKVAFSSNAAAGAMTALTASSRGAAAAMAFFGGPIGLAITGVAGGLYLLSQRSSEAEKSAEAFDASMESLIDVTERYNRASGKEREELAKTRMERIAATKAIIAETEAKVQQLKNEIFRKKRSGGGKFSGIAGPSGLQLSKERQLNELLQELQRQKKEVNDLLADPLGDGGSGLDNAGNKLHNFGKKLDDYSAHLDDAATAQEKLQQGLDDLEQDQMYEQITAGMTEVERAVYDMEVAVDELTERYGPLNDRMKKQLEQLVELARANAKASESTKKLEKQQREHQRQMEQLQREFQRPFDNALDSLQDSVRDKIRNGFDGGFDDALDIAKDFAAEMATLLIFRPQVASAGLGGLFESLIGGSTTAGTGPGTPGVAGGGGGVDILGGLSSFGSDFFSGNAAGGTYLMAAMAANEIVDEFIGKKLFGEGPLADAGSMFGLAGRGFGSMLESLGFGPEPSSKLQSGAVDLETGQLLERGGLRGEKFSQANQDQVDALAAITNQLAAALGVAGELSLAVSDRYGFEFARTGDTGVFDADSDLRKQFESASQLLGALSQEFLQEAGDAISEQFKKAIDKINFEDQEQALEDLQFIRSLQQLLDETSAYDKALQQLDKRFEELRQNAKRLELPLEKVNEAYEKQLTQLESGRIAEALTGISGLTQELRSDQLSMLQEEERTAQSLAQQFERLTGGFQSILQDLTIGQLSPLNSRQRLDAQRGRIMELGNRSQLGDVQAQAELQALLPEFVRLSGEVTGFNRQFEQDRQLAEGLARDSLDTGLRQMEIQQRIASDIASQTAVLREGFSALAEAMNSGVDVSTGGATNAAGRSLSDTGAFGLTVGEIEAIGRSLTGYTGSTGAGQLQAVLDSQGKNSEFDAALRRAAGMATGGIVTGGIAGTDSVPKMLMPGEAVIRAREVSRANSMQRAAMARGGLPGGDNQGVEMRLERVEAAVMQVARITAESGRMNDQRLATLQEDFGQLASSAQLQAAR